MNRSQAFAVVLGALVLGTVVLAAGTLQTSTQDCLTRAEVDAHLNNSRNGISLTCNEQIRQRNLAAREAAQQ